MSERKNIDQLFQEKFKNFEANPSDEIWRNIEARLDEKKRRRIIPFWWKLSGVASVLLIGLLILKSYYYPEIKKESSVANENHPQQTKTNGIKKELDFKDKIEVENSVATEQNSNKIKKVNINVKNKTLENKGVVSNGDDYVSDTRKFKNNNTLQEKNINKKIIHASHTTLAQRNPKSYGVLKNKSILVENKRKSVYEKSPSQISKTTNDTQLITENETKQDNLDIKNISFDSLKGSSISKMVTKENVKKIIDSVPKNSVNSNALEELLNEKESKLKQESKGNRWQLTSNVAPIFLGSISNGSPIDSTLSKNSKSYNTNVGFGIGISYAVNKKLSVRTGLNKMNMSYDTKNILFFTGIQAKMLANVSPTSSSAMIQIHSNSSNNSTSNTPSESGLLAFENSFIHENSGYLNQQIGYLEMPVEMTYKLLDNRFGVKLIGGFSTLFLQDNRLTIVSENRNTLLGEANNLNNIHFSTNLGLGIKYGFMKSFEFNIEPTLKYQLNTFTSNAGNFKPYIIGIYSGVSYKF